MSLSSILRELRMHNSRNICMIIMGLLRGSNLLVDDAKFVRSTVLFHQDNEPEGFIQSRDLT